ncbi:hypothetical protein EJV47_20205 [Hymenobacter gummosus]|uniref:Uncharacterized protein n=1 Tax=Hymenobacter gummosus TaxID=1776032 RepID=A0A3S0H2W8_9BACT|nr:hypothetical protein [Hymenobacter gummosus]RTQ47218.1 hypothetical protein EJV47_20205 [Hymenobacter gummosus]
MRKQLYYALAAVILGSTAVPETAAAETLLPAPAASVPTVHATTADRAETLKKRKKRKKRRMGSRRGR